MGGNTMLFLCTNIAGVLTHYPSEVAKRQVVIIIIIIIIIIITNTIMSIMIKITMIIMIMVRLSWRRGSALRLDSPPSARINNRS